MGEKTLETKRREKLKRTKHVHIAEWEYNLEQEVKEEGKKILNGLLNLHKDVKYAIVNNTIYAEYRGTKQIKDIEREILRNLEESLTDLNGIKLRRKGLGMVPGGFG